MLDCERAPSGRPVAIDRPSASGPSRHANGRPSGTSRVAPSRPRDSTGTGGSSGYRRHPRGTRVARGSAGRDRTERNPLDILPAPSASSGDQLHAAPDAEHRALAPGHGVLCVATMAAWEGSVHDLPALRAMRNGRVGTSMIHVVTRGRRIPERGHSGLPRTDGIVLPESPASSTAASPFRVRAKHAWGRNRALHGPLRGSRRTHCYVIAIRMAVQRCLKERSYSPGTPRNLTR